MVISLRALKQSFWNKEFILVASSFTLMYVIRFLGDYLIGGALWLHMLPEMFGLYVLGYWLYDEKYSWKFVLLIYILATVFVPIFVGSNPYWAGFLLVES